MFDGINRYHWQKYIGGRGQEIVPKQGRNCFGINNPLLRKITITLMKINVL